MREILPHTASWSLRIQPELQVAFCTSLCLNLVCHNRLRISSKTLSEFRSITFNFLLFLAFQVHQSTKRMKTNTTNPFTNQSELLGILTHAKLSTVFKAENNFVFLLEQSFSFKSSLSRIGTGIFFNWHPKNGKKILELTIVDFAGKMYSYTMSTRIKK